MRMIQGLAALGLATALAAGCSDRRTDNPGERAATTTERAGERTATTTERAGERTAGAAERAGDRTENALERSGDKLSDAGRDAAAGARHAGREIAGTVKSVTNDALDIGDRKVRIGDDTEFYRDGVRIERDQVRPGDEIRAAFDEAGDELRAKRIEVRRKAD